MSDQKKKRAAVCCIISSVLLEKEEVKYKKMQSWTLGIGFYKEMFWPAIVICWTSSVNKKCMCMAIYN